jgi:DNA polymerase-3 subunit gamma/tau
MSDDADSGPNLFGDAPASKPGYLVLARKYRPRTFEDLIGQEAMVRTIANSFALDRVPHAYILTGVRGVGKTTTARLLARALNYESATVKAPSIQLEPLGVHCPAIMESRHPDVYEMDAASRTGINDIREILDSVRYAPTMARMKVYIIDEVHMLSMQAFNGLLKTLEEPPPHVKFIFATTEIRKVPVTVLSRCQRFDLKRIPPDRLAAHLGAICAKEHVAVDPDGLALIARAAEGSVRDALSLLDQALVQKAGAAAAVTAAEIRDMLGLADRTRVADLLDALVRADAKAALIEVREQYDAGADPALILRDLLELTHEVARRQALGETAPFAGAADQGKRIAALAEKLSPAQAARLWQLLLKALEETARAPDPIAAAEMAMVRLAAAASLPPPEDAARLLRSGAAASGGAASGGPSEGGASGPRLAKFEDVLALVAARRDIELEIALERFVRLLEFRPGLIRYAPAPGHPADLPQRLMRALKDWTGEPWRVSADGEAAANVESIAERRARERQEDLDAIRAIPFVAEALKAFPGAIIADVREPKADGAEVTPLRTPAAKRAES